MNLLTLLDRLNEQVKESCKPVREGNVHILFASYVIQSKLKLTAIELLALNKLWSECTPFIRNLIQMWAYTFVLCSDHGTYAGNILHWHNELTKRLKYLKLSHLEKESAHLDFLLQKTTSQEGENLLREWFSQKPQPTDDEKWLRNWHLWSLERLIQEIDQHLIESPRMRKEIATLLEFTCEHNASANWQGIQPYIAVDAELNGISFFENGEVRFSEGPLALAQATVLEIMDMISAHLNLDFENEIDGLRSDLSVGEFSN